MYKQNTLDLISIKITMPYEKGKKHDLVGVSISKLFAKVDSTLAWGILDAFLNDLTYLYLHSRMLNVIILQRVQL